MREQELPGPCRWYRQLQIHSVFGTPDPVLWLPRSLVELLPERNYGSCRLDWSTIEQREYSMDWER